MPLSTRLETEDVKLWRSYAPELRAAVLALFSAKLGAGSLTVEESRIAIASLISEMKATGDLFGRFRVLSAASKVAGRAGFTAPPVAPPPAPVSVGGGLPVTVEWGDVTFKQAVEQLGERHPEIARDADQVAAVYQRDGFAAMRSADLSVTKRVQSEIESALRDGTPRREVVQAITRAGNAGDMFGDWTDSYSRTVFRNASTSSYSSGTFQMMGDPAVSSVIPALEFDSAGDSRMTPICRAFDGTVAPPGHLIWMKRTPACHHGCRSGLNLRDRFSLTSAGLYRNGAVVPRIPNQSVSPAPGFGGRHDLAIYGPRV